MDQIAKIASAVLYEGYILWPYRRSARKNQQRWTFGGIYPRGFSELSGGSDPWFTQTQCLVAGDDPVVEITVRFLQLVERQVGRTLADGTLDFVDELRLGTERYLAWDEATEREVVIPGVTMSSLAAPQYWPIAIPEGRTVEPLTDPGGTPAGALVRSWGSLQGQVEVHAEPVQDGLFRLTVRIVNRALWQGEDRRDAHRQSLLSTHTVLRAQAGEFISLTDPPETLKAAAEACQNIKTWPVLAGDEGDRHLLLSSPIILSDYPQVAPESPGDLFDGTEIDQLLLLNILTLSDEEKAEMRASDPRARAILERCESMGAEDFMGLHGTIREFRMLRDEPEPFPSIGELEQPAPVSVTVAGIDIGPGCRVRLRPRPGGDIFDLALAGKVAVIERIEQDYEERIHLAVTIEDDPGRELGAEQIGGLGHRFFFGIDEVEPLVEMER